VKKRPSIPKKDIWPKFEARILEIVTRALRMLRQDTALPEAENDISRKLCQYIHIVAHQLGKTDSSFITPSFMEACNQPSLYDKERTPHEYKIPDFQWAIYDNQEPDVSKYIKRYIIECKRLGKRESHALYITNGVVRFIKKEHSYALSSPSSAMVGYVQNMEFDDILTEVNTFAEKSSIPEIKLVDSEWKEGNVSRLNHQLDRPEVLPTPFELKHLWMDLRKTLAESPSE
jgi:hypothetical protein